MAQKTNTDQRGTFVRFRIPGARLPGEETAVPDLIVKSYWEKFQVKMQEKITKTKTMGGWVLEHWPPDLDTISVTGGTGAFLLVNDQNVRAIAGGQTSSGLTTRTTTQDDSLGVGDLGLATGNQTFMRRLSEAALNLESLAHFYRTNGASFDPDGEVSDLRDIEMVYLGDLYLGYFMDFNFQHSETSPNRYTYSFTFRVKDSYLESASPEPVLNPIGPLSSPVRNVTR